MKFNVSCHVSYDEFVLFFLKHQEWNIWIQQTIQTLEESRDCKVDKSDVPQVGSDPELKKKTHIHSRCFFQRQWVSSYII